ncbi:DUF3309 domain-containing protein [Pseudomonas sp. PDM15]|jgi:uncharacterized membrane protein YdbT with pleckstrin-like domain|uniref:DUF3309 domain-containing protein n=1 Tax=Pseudomonas sp. PDM15 TaxID=2769303 RepID=UPI001CE0A0F3|nr:DUF3309 domain-containing protein [Pseudomonas sp. PDM15]
MLMHEELRPKDRTAANPSLHRKGNSMNLSVLLLLLLFGLLMSVIPNWPYSRTWGYWPSGGLGVMVIVMLALLFLGLI